MAHIILIQSVYLMDFNSSTPLSPLVTVITAVYNGELHIAQTIESVLSQSYSNIQYIIIDGNSTDNTINIIRNYRASNLIVICEGDDGIYDAWNKGLKLAKGEWISFVGGDDILSVDAVQLYMNHIIGVEEEIEFVSSIIELVDDQLNHISYFGESWNWDRFKKNMITGHVGTFHSKNLFTKYGYFDKKYKISGDYEFLLRAREDLKSSFLNKVTVKMRSGGVSNRLLSNAIDETYNAKVKNGILSPWKAFFLKRIDKLRIKLDI